MNTIRPFWIILFSLTFLGLPLKSNAEKTSSTCYGTTGNGRLGNGRSLSLKGENFSSYSWLGWLLGRTTVHSRVKDVVVKTYEDLGSNLPGKVFIFGETGWPRGGSFKPHKTHQNGLSVDFFVPVLNPNGESVALPTHIFNKWGYDIEFDSEGRYKSYVIDFESLAAHLYFLSHNAKTQNIGIERVIFDPHLTQHLGQTKYWPYLSRNMPFSKSKPWVRHDEHYNVDFSIPCKPI